MTRHTGLGPLCEALGPDAAADGGRGRAYVRREYTWSVVLDRIEARLDARLPVAS